MLPIWPSLPTPWPSGRKRHAKTDRTDSALLRQLLQDGDLPESWIPPAIVLEWRERVRLYKALVDQRTQWGQRIHAECYQHGVAVPESQIRTEATRSWLSGDTVELTIAARQRIGTAYSMIHAIDTHAQPLKKELTRFGERQRACRALVAAHYGGRRKVPRPPYRPAGPSSRHPEQPSTATAHAA